MMLEELRILGVSDRNVPNKERIVVRSLLPTDLGKYGLMVGLRTSPSHAFPIRDNFFGSEICLFKLAIGSLFIQGKVMRE
jgi:hypothetical protein